MTWKLSSLFSRTLPGWVRAPTSTSTGRGAITSVGSASKSGFVSAVSSVFIAHPRTRATRLTYADPGSLPSYRRCGLVLSEPGRLRASTIEDLGVEVRHRRLRLEREVPARLQCTSGLPHEHRGIIVRAVTAVGHV